MMPNLEALLQKSARQHNHLCPRQILGVRIGLYGLHTLGFQAPPLNKRLLIILETDGCFADGIIAATDCTIGHRTLRIEDYGKIAATFADTQTGTSLRIATRPNLRELAAQHLPQEPRHYFNQLQAYRELPDEQMFKLTAVHLTPPLQNILSRPGVRVNCNRCGEEIINQREIYVEGAPLCRFCAQNGYYTLIPPVPQESAPV